MVHMIEFVWSFMGLCHWLPTKKWGKSLLELPHLTWPWPTLPWWCLKRSPFEHQNYRWYQKTLSFYLAWNRLKPTSFVTVEKVVNREFADNSGWCNSEKKIAAESFTLNGTFRRANHFAVKSWVSLSEFGDDSTYSVDSKLKTIWTKPPFLGSNISIFPGVNVTWPWQDSHFLQEGIHLLHLVVGEFYRIFPP